jgi:hypothetical protein
MANMNEKWRIVCSKCFMCTSWFLDQLDLQKYWNDRCGPLVSSRESYLRGFAAGAESLTHWIDVSKRLPDEHNTVLIYNGDFHIGSLIYEKIESDGDYYWQNNFYDDFIDSVTHWMPLPEPPDEK